MQPPTGTQDAAPTREMPPVPPASQNPLPNAPTMFSAKGDECAKCGALVAPDQRYCIECGERRGDPRLPFMDGRTATQTESAAQPALIAPGYYPSPAPPNNKWSSGMALLSTIAVLLLSMGVGVMIGNKGNSGSATGQPVVLGGGASAAAGEATAATGKDAAASSEAVGENGETKSGIDANAIAKKNGVKLAKPDVDLGDKCEKGAVGCNEKGEFDGEYFK